MEEKQKEKKPLLDKESKILNKKWVRIVLIVLLILLVLWLLYSTTDMTIKLPF
jgi:uncharacterized membrane protein YukC